mgnify:CR=1 FL=1
MKKNKLTEKTRTMFLFTLPSVIMYTVFFTVTVCIGIYYSFTDWNGIRASYKMVGVSNYINAFSDEKFLSALKFNIVYTVVYVMILVIISMAIAVGLNKVKRGSTFFRSIYFLPAVFAMVTVGLIWNELFYRALPMLGEALEIEVLSKSLLGGRRTAAVAVLIVNLWQGCSIPIILFLAGLQSVPVDLYEAATIDGASKWNQFRYVTVPYLIPILNMVVITQVKAGLTIFDYIMAMTNGGPGGATQSVGILIYNQAMKGNAYSKSVAESMILFAIVGVVSVLTLRFNDGRQVNA